MYHYDFTETLFRSTDYPVCMAELKILVCHRSMSDPEYDRANARTNLLYISNGKPMIVYNNVPILNE